MYSQYSRENATPLAFYKEVPPPPPVPRACSLAFFVKQYFDELAFTFLRERPHESKNVLSESFSQYVRSGKKRHFLHFSQNKCQIILKRSTDFYCWFF